MHTLSNEIILGSQSPRRKEIFGFFSVPFRQVSPDFDELSVMFGGDPASYAIEIAKQKALSLVSQFPNHTILTADTVVFRNGTLYLKPETLDEAMKMLRELSGKEHQVYTGVVVASRGKVFSDAELTRVFFSELTDPQLRTYVNTFQPLDKAGGYAIQKGGSLIVKRIEGCYYNVMGLPLHTVRRLMLNAGVDLWDFLKHT